MSAGWSECGSPARRTPSRGGARGSEEDPTAQPRGRRTSSGSSTRIRLFQCAHSARARRSVSHRIACEDGTFDGAGCAAFLARCANSITWVSQHSDVLPSRVAERVSESRVGAGLLMSSSSAPMLAGRRSRRACRARSNAGGELARVPAGASRRDRRSVHLEVTNRRPGSLGHGEPRERRSRDRARREQRPSGHCRGSGGPSCRGAVRRRCAVYRPRGRGRTSDAAARRRRYARSAVAAPRIRGPDPSRRTRCAPLWSR